MSGRMRRILAMLALALIGMPPMHAFAADGGVRVTPAAAPSIVLEGETFAVQVRVDNAWRLAGISFELHYDTARLQLAKNSNDQPDIRAENGFQYFGGGKINEEEGIILYPVIYTNPLSTEPISTTAVTIRFVALEAGPHPLQLFNIQAVDFASRQMEVDPNAPNAVTAIAAAPLEPIGEERFSMSSVFALLRPGSGGPALDLNGNGETDAEEVRFVLYNIGPVSFSAAPTK